MTRRVGLVVGLVAASALVWLPSGLHAIDGAGSRPAKAAAVAAVMAIWWLFDALPMAVTACMPLLLFPLLGVFGDGLLFNLGHAAAPYVDGYIFLFVGGMVLGAALESCGLHRRVALHIMRVVGTQPSQLLLGMLCSTAAVSMWISNTATAVMMLPIAMALLAQLEAHSGGVRLQRFGASLMLTVAWGANLGGIGTKIGTGTNSIFCGYAARVLHQDIGFGQFILLAFPFVVLMVPLAWGVLWWHARGDVKTQRGGADLIAAELLALGAVTPRERVVGVVFALAALGWVSGDVLKDLVAPWVPALWEGYRFQGKHLEAAVALLAGAACLVTRQVNWAELKRVPWGTLLLLGGSFAMASGLEHSGFSGWLSAQAKGIRDLPVWLQHGATAFATIGLSAVASNTATINVMLTVLPPNIPLLLTATFAASCDFALPAGTPPNAMVFGSGRIQLPVMMRVGVVLDVLAALVLLFFGATWIAWLGS